MGMTIRGGRGRRFDDINVTPLVDVMLVLLVVFMVTAPLLTTGLRVELPQVRAHNTPVRDTKLIVTVTKEEKILFGEKDVTANVEQALLESKRVQREGELYIRADKEARYGPVARVVAAARAAGVEGLNLLVEPEIVEAEETEPATKTETNKTRPRTKPRTKSSRVSAPEPKRKPEETKE